MAMDKGMHLQHARVQIMLPPVRPWAHLSLYLGIVNDAKSTHL